MHDRLRTRDRLARMGITTDVGCVLCDHGFETRDHLFLYCNFASEVRDRLMNRLGLQWVGSSWEDWWRWALKVSVGGTDIARSRRALPATLVYLIWQERNYRIFRHLENSPTSVSMRAFWFLGIRDS
ncbi:hypothetical protein Dimus_038146 [Dionaea muscipula]